VNLRVTFFNSLTFLSFFWCTATDDTLTGSPVRDPIVYLLYLLYIGGGRRDAEPENRAQK